MGDRNTPPEPTLKVSDRRHFTVSGERRPDVEGNQGQDGRSAPAPPLTVAPTTENAATTSKPKIPAPPSYQRLAAKEVSFASFLESLYATAMFQLGALAQPGQPPEQDIEGARETIDLLGLLREKTHGNLSAEESRLFDSMLYELRMVYVQSTQATPRTRPNRR